MFVGGYGISSYKITVRLHVMDFKLFAIEDAKSNFLREWLDIFLSLGGRNVKCF